MPVCITGMHRSGTSMVAHALSLCGLDLGPEDQLLPADAWNSDGYWENRALVELDDWALEQLGGSWDLPPAAAATPELREEFVEAARRAVAEVGFGEPWGWKDPRACLLADLWHEAVTDLRFVVAVRNPVEVALSLRRRGATSPQLALSLWSAYYAEVLARVPASDRVVVAYDAFLGDPSGSVERLVGRLGLAADSEQQQEAVSSVDVRLRHHVGDSGSLHGVPAQVVDLYEALLSEARDGAPAEPPPQDPSTLKPTRAVATRSSGLTTLVAAYQERDRLRVQVERLTADRDTWHENSEKSREDASRLAIDRDAWRTQARHWRAETERLVAAEQRRLGWRFRQARLRYARRVWRALPAAVRNQLRPRIYGEFIGPPPLQKDEAPPA